MNIALAAFNMLPGFPMDGGRVLRALLARRRSRPSDAIAAEVGKMFAVLLGLFGVFVLGNLFLAGLAFFIYIGAAGESRQTSMRAAFEGVTVADVMTPRTTSRQSPTIRRPGTHSDDVQGAPHRLSGRAQRRGRRPRHARRRPRRSGRRARGLHRRRRDDDGNHHDVRRPT